MALILGISTLPATDEMIRLANTLLDRIVAMRNN